MRRDSNCGGVTEYLEHLSWLLLLKFLDDQFASKPQQVTSPKGANPIPGPFRWLNWTGKALGKCPRHVRWTPLETMHFVRKKLVPRLQRLSGTPEKALIASIFKNRQLVICASPENLVEVIGCLDKLQFQTSDQVHTISQIYEELLAKVGTENNLAGEFYTPRPVIRLILDILRPQIGEKIYDPACGSCGFLAEAYESLTKSAASRKDHLMLQAKTFFGNEKKALPALLGSINVILHGLTGPVVRRRNTLETDQEFQKEQFDVIVTNPPFGGMESKTLTRKFTAGSTATELLFLEHVINRLRDRPGSRCGVVVPEGVLFRRGAFQRLRIRLLSEFDLFLIVSLPPGTFAPYSDVKTAVLFFRRPGPTKQILYALPSLPSELKKLSKGYPIADIHFDGVKLLYAQWESFCQESGKRPASSTEWWTEDATLALQNGVDLSPRQENIMSTADGGSRSVREVLSDLMTSTKELSDRVGDLVKDLNDKRLS